MGIVVTLVVAFCIGAAAIAGMQAAGLSWIKRQLHSDAARSGLPVATPVVSGVDLRPMTSPIFPKMAPIDTRAAEARGVMAAQRRVDQQIRAAQSAVPQPRSFPGMRRW
jgi:hypothetical protein